MLRALIPAGWTWAKIAHAMNVAGIRYAAGVPRPGGKVSRGVWTGEQLQRAVRKAAERANRRAQALAVLPAEQPRASSARVHPRPPAPSPREMVGLLAGSTEFPPASSSAAPGPDPVQQKVRVFGALPAEQQALAEPDAMQRLVDEKAARTQSIVDRFLKGSKDNGKES